MQPGIPKCPEFPSASPEKPSVFSRELTDATVTEGEDLTLVCETTAPDSPVCWTKDGKALRPSPRCQLSQEGHRAQLVIKGTTVQDGGRYKCESGGSWSSSIVRVHGELPGSRPPLRAPSVHVQVSAALVELTIFHLCLLTSNICLASLLCLVFCYLCVPSCGLVHLHGFQRGPQDEYHGSMDWAVKPQAFTVSRSWRTPEIQA